MYQSFSSQALVASLFSCKTSLPHSFHHKLRGEDDVKGIPWGEDDIKIYQWTPNRYTLSWCIPVDAYGDEIQIGTRCAHVPTTVLISQFLPPSISHNAMHVTECTWRMEYTRRNAYNGMHTTECRWWNTYAWWNSHEGICTWNDGIHTMESARWRNLLDGISPMESAQRRNLLNGSAW